MHQPTPEIDELIDRVIAYTRRQLAREPQDLVERVSPNALSEAAGPTVTESGLGGEEALRIFTEVLAPAGNPSDHPRYLAYVAGAPSTAAVLGDFLVAPMSVNAGSHLEGAGIAHAEGEVIEFLCREAGLPDGAHGVFLSGEPPAICQLSSPLATMCGALDPAIKGQRRSLPLPKVTPRSGRPPR